MSGLPIMWLLKRQATLETSTFGSEQVCGCSTCPCQEG
jgi:hypothetical protein